jgi:hypothetical protein
MNTCSKSARQASLCQDGYHHLPLSGLSGAPRAIRVDADVQDQLGLGIPLQGPQQGRIDAFERELLLAQPHRFRVALVMPGRVAGGDADRGEVDALLGKTRVVAVALRRVYAFVQQRGDGPVVDEERRAAVVLPDASRAHRPFRQGGLHFVLAELVGVGLESRADNLVVLDGRLAKLHRTGVAVQDRVDGDLAVAFRADRAEASLPLAGRRVAHQALAGPHRETVVGRVELGRIVRAAGVAEQKQIRQRRIFGAIGQAQDVIPIRLHQERPAPEQVHLADAVGLADLRRFGSPGAFCAAAQVKLPRAGICGFSRLNCSEDRHRSRAYPNGGSHFASSIW